jgi:hypothetical protein
MVVSPLLRGMLGIEAAGGGRTLAFAPQLPADWDRVAVRNVPAGESRFDLSVAREPGVLTVVAERRASAPQGGAAGALAAGGAGGAGAAGALAAGAATLVLAPAFPLDARVRSVTVNGRETPFEIDRRGDVQRARVTVPVVAGSVAASAVRVAFTHDEGTEVYAPIEPPARGASSEGLRILRARAASGALHLVVEGLAGRTYAVGVRSPRSVGEVAGVKVVAASPSTVTAGEENVVAAPTTRNTPGMSTAVTPIPAGVMMDGTAPGRRAGDTQLAITFDGPAGQYVRRTIDLPLR